MRFVFDDGGREAAGYRGKAGDCVVRAVAIAMQRPYADVYSELSQGCKTQRKTRRGGPHSSARDGVDTRRKWFRDYMAARGWTWTPTMHVGEGCKVHLADGELPQGRLIVAVSKHYTTVIDGVIHDTHDPQREVHTVHTIPVSEQPKPHWRLLRDCWHSKQYADIQRRCVYGYWSQA